MANKDPKGKTKYWKDGASSTLIKSKEKTQIKSQVYWYNGQPQGYVAGYIEPAKLKTYIILLGF
jgi:hypothetical protein